jgi:hypothetical protein
MKATDLNGICGLIRAQHACIDAEDVATILQVLGSSIKPAPGDAVLQEVQSDIDYLACRIEDDVRVRNSLADTMLAADWREEEALDKVRGL